MNGMGGMNGMSGINGIDIFKLTEAEENKTFRVCRLFLFYISASVANGISFLKTKQPLPLR